MSPGKWLHTGIALAHGGWGRGDGEKDMRMDKS